MKRIRKVQKRKVTRKIRKNSFLDKFVNWSLLDYYPNLRKKVDEDGLVCEFLTMFGWSDIVKGIFLIPFIIVSFWLVVSVLLLLIPPSIR